MSGVRVSHRPPPKATEWLHLIDFAEISGPLLVHRGGTHGTEDAWTLGTPSDRCLLPAAARACPAEGGITRQSRFDQRRREGKAGQGRGVREVVAWHEGQGRSQGPVPGSRRGRSTLLALSSGW